MNLTQEERVACIRILNGTDGFIARHLNKAISLPLSIFLSRVGVIPNQITFFNILLGLLAGWVVSQPGYYNLLLGGVLFQLVSIVDGCDGEVAKIKTCSTRFGAWFDTVGDNLSFVAFIIGVTFALYQETHARWIIHAATVSLASFALLLCIMISYLIRLKNDSASLTIYEKEVVSETAKKQSLLVKKFIYYGKFLVKKDFFAFLFFVLAVLNLPGAIVFFAALGTTAVAIVLSLITIKNRRSSKAPVREEVAGIAP